MKAMILAAGLGSRLRPVTNTIPKALVAVKGKTLLQYHIERIIDFGINDIVINVHHFASKVREFLHEKNNFNVNIIISDESDKLLDTGGGIKKASSWLKGDESILIQNVDIYSNIDYKKMLSQHLKRQALATVAVRHRETSRYLLFNNKHELCGWENTKTKQKIITRETSGCENLGFSCVHFISPELFHYLPNNDVFSIIDSYLELSKEHLISSYVHNNDYWFDIGTPEKLEKLEYFLNTDSLK